MNVGLPFQTPEQVRTPLMTFASIVELVQYFHDEPAHPFKITGFDAKAYVAKRGALASAVKSSLICTSYSPALLFCQYAARLHFR